MSRSRAVSVALLALAFGQAASAQGAPQATSFTVRVENISRGEVLKLSTGKTAPFVAAPTFWVLHTANANPIFTGGRPEAGNGLEQLAETGNPEGLFKYVPYVMEVRPGGDMPAFTLTLRRSPWPVLQARRSAWQASLVEGTVRLSPKP